MKTKIHIIFSVLISLLVFEGNAQKLFEDFESGIFPPDGWSVVDQDGDGFNWGTSSEGINNSNASVSYSWLNRILNPENYLISPNLRVEKGEVLSFWVSAPEINFFNENYQIRVSTTDSLITSFSDLIFEETLQNTDWRNIILPLDNYVGQDIYIAFVHTNVTDQWRILLDDIEINQLNIYTSITEITCDKNDGSVSLDIELGEKDISSSLMYSWEALYDNYSSNAKNIDNLFPNVYVLNIKNLGNINIFQDTFYVKYKDVGAPFIASESRFEDFVFNYGNRLLEDDENGNNINVNYEPSNDTVFIGVACVALDEIDHFLRDGSLGNLFEGVLYDDCEDDNNYEFTFQSFRFDFDEVIRSENDKAYQTLRIEDLDGNTKEIVFSFEVEFFYNPIIDEISAYSINTDYGNIVENDVDFNEIVVEKGVEVTFEYYVDPVCDGEIPYIAWDFNGDDIFDIEADNNELVKNTWNEVGYQQVNVQGFGKSGRNLKSNAVSLDVYVEGIEVFTQINNSLCGCNGEILIDYNYEGNDFEPDGGFEIRNINTNDVYKINEWESGFFDLCSGTYELKAISISDVGALLEEFVIFSDTIDVGFERKRWYLDNDRDNYGTSEVFLDSCEQPVGYVSIPGDCNDNNDKVYPGALEIFDGLDNNCDGLTFSLSVFVSLPENTDNYNLIGELLRIDNGIELIESKTITELSFDYSSLEEGQYIVKIIPNDDIHPDWVTTYSGNEIIMAESIPINIDSNVSQIIDLQSVASTFNNNNSEIKGQTYIRTDGTINAINEVLVYLIDVNNRQIVGKSISEGQDGFFNFDSLSIGNYLIKADYENKPIAIDNPIISIEEPFSDIIVSVFANEQNISSRIESITDIEPELNEVVVIWPNPFEENLKIESTKSLKDISIFMMDGLGRRIKDFGHFKSLKTLTLDTEGLAKGLYILQLKSKEKTSSWKVLK